MTFGLTPQGFKIKRLPDIQTDQENQLVAEFGEINVTPQSVFGQLIGVYSKIAADYWENQQDVYFSQYPNSAEGVALDNVVLLNGITRLPATQTIVNVIVYGNNPTLIPANSQARIVSNNTIFYNPSDILISSTRAVAARVTVEALAGQIYTIILNSQSFSFSLPIITWVGSFVTGNSITVTINGTQLGPVGYAGSSASTNAAIAALILTHPDVAGAGTPTGSTIYITPVVGKYVTVGTIAVTGGVSQPGYTITYDTPITLDNVALYLAAMINAGTQPITAVDNLDGTLDLTADDTTVPFSISVGANLIVSNIGSPGIFLSRDFGPISAPANSLTGILTPINGWTSINNPTAGAIGRLRETDAELRLRRQNSLRTFGSATVEAIRANLLQNVANVTNVLIFENRTMTQEPITATLSTALITGNTVAVTVDGTVLSPTVYATSHLNTMQLVANKILTVPGVSSVVIGGSGNLTLTINVESGNELTLDNFDITLGASQPTVLIRQGRPPKSFEAVVQGGTDQDVANQIWLSKPAGIQTFGNVNDYGGVPIIDSQGNTQYIYFSRALPIYLWVDVALTLYDAETFPVDGIQQVQAAILAYGNSLGIGADVLLQRVLAQIFQVPGIASGVMQLAATALSTDSPSYSSADIVIAENEISVWDTSRINVTVV